MPDTIAVKIALPESFIDADTSLQRAPLFYSVSDGAAQLYDGTGKAIPTSKIAKDRAFLFAMHALRARTAAELAAVARLYLPAETEITAVALPEVTPDPIRFTLEDWRKTEHPDAASWPDDPIAAGAREIVLTHDNDRIVLTMPLPGSDGTEAISVWLELQGRRLVVRAYDPEHESPVAIRIGETAILIDTHDRDAEEAHRTDHPRPTVGNQRR